MQEHIAPEAKSRKKLGVERGAQSVAGEHSSAEAGACRRKGVGTVKIAGKTKMWNAWGNGFPRGYRVERAKGMEKRGVERNDTLPSRLFVSTPGFGWCIVDMR